MVYRARRLDSRTEVAVKVVHPHLLSTAETRRRFLREGEIGIRLSHPGLVKVFERGEANGRAFLAMEYVPGPTIRELLGRRGPLPLHLAARLARDVADAVASMHALGIVHRDLKNENVIVAASGHPKLLDFGLARLTEGTRFTQSGHALGTPDYMAPEQVQGDPPTLATDVWALGAGLYEMLTGRLPFGRGDAVSTFRAILDVRPAPPHEIRAEIPESLDLIVLRALEKDPAERWPSAAALRDALSAVLPALPVEAGEEDFLVVRALQTERTDDWGVLAAEEPDGAA
jgi:serine/threonine-protein kinase